MDTNKPISHFERVHTKTSCTPIEYHLKDVPVTETIICPVTKRPLQKIKFKKPDTKCSKIFKVSDFSLESHLHAGSIDTLNSTRLSHDKLTNMQIAENQVQSIINSNTKNS